MYDPSKYFFDRTIAIPKGMLDDCGPFPRPIRTYLDCRNHRYVPSKKKRVHTDPDSNWEAWRDHLAASIGFDLQGLTFYQHLAALNIVVFGEKRWILWDHAGWDNERMGEVQQWLTRPGRTTRNM